MNKQNIDSKLVAKFMGYYPSQFQPETVWEIREEGKISNTLEFDKYRTSWSKLMPLLEKIMLICEKQLICHRFFIGLTSINITIEYGKRKFKEFDCYYIEYHSRKEAIYSICVKFIKWYQANYK